MFEKLIEKIGKYLGTEKIPYMIIGGQAVLLYGEPRLTKDIDITLGIGLDSLDTLLTVVKRMRLKILVDNVEDFVSKTMVLPALSESTGIRIDFILSFSEYEKEAIKRGKKIRFGSHMVKFASLEDVLIHKIIAGRARDIEDIKSILIKNPNFNKKYITKWLKQFDSSLNLDTQDKFTSILKEIKET